MLPLILLMIIIPIAAFAAIFATKAKHSRNILLASMLANMLITLSIFVSSLMAGSANMSESYAYLPSLGINLTFRINATVLTLLIMSSVVLFAAALAGNPEKHRPRLSSALIAMFQLAAVGLFTSSNLIIFFVFWDIGVITLFFMINLLGSANRKAASMNFLLYEILASSLLLLGILMIYFYTPVHSFDMQYIAANIGSMSKTMQSVIFLVFLIAFMINMPIFPLHSWLPDAHTEASTQGSMILSGIFTKFGAFGALIIFSLLPISANYSIYIAALATISAIYAVFVLMKQKDLKRIIAYSTIVELGIIMVGISAGNALGTAGATYAMLAHGLAIALMFLAVGIVKYLFGERSISVLKGIVSNAASTVYVFLFGALAMIGLPLTAGFVADVMLFIGAFQAFSIYGLIPLAALVLMGAYLYFVIDKSMFSAKPSGNSDIVDFISTGQKVGYAILVFFILLYGVFPFTILMLMR